MEMNVIITAAGNSGRMGFMKPFLKWDAHEDFLGKIVGEYLAFGCRPLVVLNEEGLRLVRSANPPWLGSSVIITNQHPELERFHSVKLAAEFLTRNSWCFIQSVDNPFISAGILKGLADLRPEGYSQPVCKGRNGHPVFVSPGVVVEIQKSGEGTASLRMFWHVSKGWSIRHMTNLYL
jgi:CTP:molybdopterin cytidylyltransferase MocA